jgi:hypothetical protein
MLTALSINENLKIFQYLVGNPMPDCQDAVPIAIVIFIGLRASKADTTGLKEVWLGSVRQFRRGLSTLIEYPKGKDQPDLRNLYHYTKYWIE